MSETPEQKWAAVVDFAEGHDVVLLVALGKTVLHGIRRVEGIEKFAQKNGASYVTHFPMADGREWSVAVEPYVESLA